MLIRGLKRRLSLGNAGDTIVEVMIVLAVLGLAIGISYATANRSLLNARQAQENSQASELAQSQIEQLRPLSDANCALPAPDTNHCIYAGSPYGASNKPFCIVAGAVKNAKTYPGCTGAGEAGRYAVSITRQDASYTFTVVVQWPDVLGEGTDTVTLSYTLPPPAEPPIGDDSVAGGGDDGGTQPLSASLQTVACTRVKASNYKVSAKINLAGTPGDTVTLARMAGMSAVSTTPAKPVLDANGVLTVTFNASYISFFGATVQVKDGSQTQNVMLCSPS